MENPLDDLLPSDQDEDGDDDGDRDEDDAWDEDENEIPRVELPGLDAALATHYRPRAVRERLKRAAAGEDFRAVVRELAARCASEPRALPDGIGFSLHGDPASALGLANRLEIETLQKEFRSRGALVLGGGAAGDEPTLTLLPTTDPLEALAAFGVAGPKENISNSQVVELFRSYPAVITDIRRDTVVGRFEPRPENVWALALEVYNLCPDTIERFSGDFEALMASLETTGTFSLRWG